MAVIELLANSGGAWEIAARYSYIDLNDSTIRGDIMQERYCRRELVLQPVLQGGLQLNPLVRFRSDWFS